MKVGIIGAGLIGQKRAFHLPPNLQLHSVFDPSADALDAFRERMSSPLVIADNSSDLINDSQIDAVIIATPHNRLAPLAIEAARAGKHCFIEKPGGVSADDIRMVKSEATKFGVLVRYGFNHRFHPAIQQLKTLIDSNRYGDVMNIRGVYGHGGRLGYETEWRANRTISGGGELVDQGSHLIDLVHFLVGPSRLLFSRLSTNFWKMNVEDNAFLALETSAGVVAWLHASWTEWKNVFRLEVALTHARIDVVGIGGSYGPERLIIHEMKPELGPPDSHEYLFDSPDQSWRNELDDFSSALEGSESMGASADDALATWSVLESAYSR